jgi:type II secretory ATPase GspE/PulE/Tfp pilus assembly ATPase PilB-like protein
MAFPEEVKHRLSPSELAMFAGGKCWHGVGCEKCSESGIRGRIGYFELVATSSPMRAAIAARAGTQELRRVAPPFMTMRQDGIMKASQGLTAVTEVLRATQDAEEVGA